MAIACGVWAVWNSLPPKAKEDIWDWAKAALSGTGRTSTMSDDDGNGINGGVARIRIRIDRAAAGHLEVRGHLANLDGGTRPHVRHFGTAAHHRHPDMRGHLQQIVMKSHAFLQSRNV